MKTTRTFFLATKIVLLSVFTIGCTPDTQNRLLPSNTFDVNISVLSNYERTDTFKTIVVDGDSIIFELLNDNNYRIQDLLWISVSSPDFEILKVKTYPFNYVTHSFDSTYPIGNIDATPGGVLINDAYAANDWDTFYYFSPDMATHYGFDKWSDKYVTFPWTVLHNDIDGTPWIKYEMTPNTDQYIVLRKHIKTQYQYYWIRTRNETIYSSDSMNYTRTIKILDGKYQMNSIITGQ